MTSKETTRLTLIQDLLTLARPLPAIAADLARMTWDYDGPGFDLTRQHLSGLLHLYQKATLTDDDVEAWANLVEGRDEIGFEVGHESVIEEVLHELANPLLTQELNQGRAAALLSILS